MQLEMPIGTRHISDVNRGFSEASTEGSGCQVMAGLPIVVVAPDLDHTMDVSPLPAVNKMALAFLLQDSAPASPPSAPDLRVATYAYSPVAGQIAASSFVDAMAVDSVNTEPPSPNSATTSPVTTRATSTAYSGHSTASSFLNEQDEHMKGNDVNEIRSSLMSGNGGSMLAFSGNDDVPTR